MEKINYSKFNWLLKVNPSSDLGIYSDKFEKVSHEYGIFFLKKGHFTTISDCNWKAYIFGDLLNKEVINEKLISEGQYYQLKGIFTLIITGENYIKIVPSLGSLMPIFINDIERVFSDNIQVIKQISVGQSIDKQFILEALLFNYGFANRTLYSDIHLNPVNTIISIESNGTIKSNKYLDFASLYEGKINKGKKVIFDLRDEFIQNSKTYLDCTNLNINFTSGFDGRTLVSCASYNKLDFTTSSFGLENNMDVVFPKEQSMKLGIHYDWIDLSQDEYIHSHFERHANNLQNLNPGFNNFLYPHFPYLAEVLASKGVEYLVTGYMGSEIFRTMHINGALTSDILIKIFSSNSMKEIQDAIQNSNRLKYIIRSEFQDAIDCLTEEILTFKNNASSDLTTNQRFYLFLMEETFRKVFGSWIVGQSQYLQVRSPFWDFEFISLLMKTRYFGANNDFFTHNPLKRFKGQVPYAYIIKKTYPELYKMSTGKGYSPASLTTPQGLLSVASNYLNKRLINKTNPKNIDNLSIISGIQDYVDTNPPEENDGFFNTIQLSKDIQSFNSYMSEFDRDLAAQVLSLQKGIANG